MAAFRFTYTSPALNGVHSVIKHADREEQALAFFASGTAKQKNLYIIKLKSPMTLIKTEKI